MNFLQPLVSRDGHISSFGPGNMLMIVDSATNIEQILEILDSIDKPGVEEAEIILLKHANADDVVKIITETLVLSSKGQPSAIRGLRPGAGAGSICRRIQIVCFCRYPPECNRPDRGQAGKERP